MKLKNLFLEWARPIVEDHDTPRGSSSYCRCEVCTKWDEHMKDEGKRAIKERKG